MYRLIMYYLFGLFIFAEIFAYLGWLPFSALALSLSLVIIGSVCIGANYILAKIFNAQTNVESNYITALILVFLITPLQAWNDISFYALAIGASIFAISSKYILAVNKKHVFNPAAVALVVISFFGYSASWWIGTSYMLVPVLFGGILMTKKLIRYDLVLSFLLVATASVLFSRLGSPVFETLDRLFIYSPLLFFAFIMLTEPLTSPHTRQLRIMYGVLIGLMFAPTAHLGPIYFTPELALVVGNFFSFVVSPKERLILTLKDKKKLADGIYDFVFSPDRNFSFKPGQYLEWTLMHKGPDTRGNRRYFTVASSPLEPEVHMGVKFYENSSSFKNTLLSMKLGDKIVASSRSGDFTLPKDQDKKLVFMAGGIGITPFRSMIKHLLIRQEKRDIALIYSAKTSGDIAYREVFEKAETELGIKTIYAITEGSKSFVTANTLRQNISDWQERIYYLSGPRAMVVAFEKMLKEMGVNRSQIKKDFFPGFA